MRRSLFGRLALVLICALAVAACQAVRQQAVALGIGLRCPFEEQSFCDFVLELEAALEADDAEAFLGLVQRFDCQQHGHGFYGPVPEDFCGSSQWCYRQSHFFGEGTCLPLPDPATFEDVLGSQYVSIDGVVYPGFPSRSSSAVSAGPAVLIRVSGLHYMRALMVVGDSGGWQIASIYPYKEGLGEQLGVRGTVIPWERPYEERLAWLGMQVPLDAWQVGDHPWDTEITRYAVLAHRSLADCRISLVAEDPYFLAGQPNEWHRGLAHAEFEAVGVYEVRFSHPDDGPTMTYYEIIDSSGRRFSYPRRLGYFLLESAEPSDECTDAISRLLATLDPAGFPDLPVAQG